ncbi:LppX domain protein [Halobacterium salinarum]|uniref:LppX domain protein n=2 Tax=Halobacterium salinarum (strain ATCC 33171 / DSM 3754 / JCM 8978 / NBRC 102687 / NCIMB 764 / 91-R6) TaxID=2597657 RepID=A0A4D6GXH0_HALS9|nr:LppX domain protein [Halobacterium salinarum]
MTQICDAMVSVRLCLILALVVLGGCVFVLTDDHTGAPPSTAVAAGLNDIESVSATEVSGIRFGNTSSHTTTTLRISLAGDSLRRFSRVREPNATAGDVTLVTGHGTMAYDASRNRVTRAPHNDAAVSVVDQAGFYERVVAAAHDGSTVTVPSRGVSPLPAIPAADADATDNTTDVPGYAVSYLGARTVAGRNAHGFRLTPATDAAADMTQTLWLDARYYYPLRTVTTVTSNATTYHLRSHLENVTFNADLSAKPFSWTPPADATTEIVDTTTRRFDALAALRDASRLSVPDPELPAAYSFDSGRMSGAAHRQVTAEYSAPGAHRATMTKFTAPPGGPALDAGAQVTVAGQPASYLVTGHTRRVSWACGGVQYRLSSGALNRSQLLASAAAVACR